MMNEKDLDKLLEDIHKFRLQNNGDSPKQLKMSPEFYFELYERINKESDND